VPVGNRRAPDVSRSYRSFVLRHTRLRPVDGLEPLRLNLADAVLPLWHATQTATGDPDAPLPYWAFAWAGGLAIGQLLHQEPTRVAGLRVLDLGSGSGLCAIAAARAGAARVIASEIDPIATAAIGLNARGNGVRVAISRHDLLEGEIPDNVDVILAGDLWYESGLAARVTAWLLRASGTGITVLVGDPGRRYLPSELLDPIAHYGVRTTTELEDMALKTAGVYRLHGPPPVRGARAVR
jgi:predicted nicotinamide N-methyase